MANPQPDQFTKFSNELLDKFIPMAGKLPAQATVIWLAIFRKTYGFQKKKDRISLSQLSKMTGIDASHIGRSLKRLKDMNMIISDNGIRGIQKDYDKWTATPLRGLPTMANAPDGGGASATSGGDASACNGGELPPPVADTKESIKKEEKKEEKEMGEHREIVDYFHQKYLEHFGEKYSWNESKDFNLVKLLLKQHPQEEIQKQIDMLFNSQDPFLANKKTIGMLSSQWNQLTQERIKGYAGRTGEHKGHTGHTAGEKSYGKIGKIEI